MMSRTEILRNTVKMRAISFSSKIFIPDTLAQNLVLRSKQMMKPIISMLKVAMTRLSLWAAMIGSRATAMITQVGQEPVFHQI